MLHDIPSVLLLSSCVFKRLSSFHDDLELNIFEKRHASSQLRDSDSVSLVMPADAYNRGISLEGNDAVDHKGFLMVAITHSSRVTFLEDGLAVSTGLETPL